MSLRKSKSLLSTVYFILLFNSILFSQANLNRARLAFQAGNYNETIELLKDVNLNTFSSSEIIDLLIDSHLRLKLYEEALKYSFQAKKIFGNKSGSEKYDLIIGNILALQEKYDEALKYLNDYLKKNSKDSQAKKIIASVYAKLSFLELQNKKFERALDLIRTALKYDQYEKNYYALLAQIHYEYKKPEEAAKDLHLFHLANLKDDDFLRSKIMTQFVANDFKSAISELEELYKKNPNDKSIIFNLAFAYRYNNKIQEASNLYKETIRRFPDEKTFYEEYFQFCDLLNLSDEKIEALLIMKRHFPEDSIRIKFEIAKTYDKKKDFESSRKIYLQIIDNKESASKAFINFADTYLEEKDTVQAIDILIDAKLKLNNNLEIREKLLSLYSNQKKYQSAIDLSEEILSLNENNKFALLSLANAYYNLSNFEKAEIYFLKAAKIDKSDPFSRFYLSEIYFQKDKKLSYKYLLDAINLFIISVEQIFSNIQNVLMKNNIIELANKKNEITNYEIDYLKQIDLLKNCFQKLRAFLSDSEYEQFLRELSVKHSRAIFPYNYLGLYYFEKKDYKRSKENFIKVLSINSKVYEAQLYLAKIYEELNNYQQAELAFQRALAINKDQSEPYDGIIRIRKKNSKLNELSKEWLALYNANRRDSIFVEKLIEILHLIGDFKTAKEIIQSKNKN